MVLFWWSLLVSTEAGGGLELVLVWWPLPECSWRLEGASSWCWFDGHCRSVHGDWRGV